MNKTNKIAHTLKGIAWVIWGGGFLISILSWGMATDLFPYSGGGTGFFFFLITALIFFISGLLIYAFGEIIQLLQNIDANTKGPLKDSSADVLPQADIPSGPVTPIIKDSTAAVCPACGEINGSGRKSCYFCGVEFIG